MKIERTGQCRGGPDDGNLISATVDRVAFRATYVHHLDGHDRPPSTLVVAGTYVWNAVTETFDWFRH